MWYVRYLSALAGGVDTRRGPLSCLLELFISLHSLAGYLVILYLEHFTCLLGLLLDGKHIGIAGANTLGWKAA